MGLDMYLYRFKRIGDCGPEEITAANEYFDWLENPDGQKYTFEKWCGTSEDELPAEEYLEEIKKERRTEYWAWDEEHKYPHIRNYEQVACWRKANAIHKWFVDHVQDGEDDCEYHDEVTKELLEELRDACADILGNAVLVSGKVENGYRFTNGKKEPIIEDGKYVINPEVCDDVLPTESGFFFGSTNYDEWYMEDIKYTFEVCNKLLDETDFDTHMLYYVSSW